MEGLRTVFQRVLSRRAEGGHLPLKGSGTIAGSTSSTAFSNATRKSASFAMAWSFNISKLSIR